ncbi:hypothetical protein [Paraburkholderia fungorum]|uniref:hypothetical protein n=1 Tax=Paraburkholderia fungorum TaxID=134537 RepID=UPI0038BB6039
MTTCSVMRGPALAPHEPRFPPRRKSMSRASAAGRPAVLREPADGRQPVRFTLLETLLKYRPTAYF